MPPVGCRRNNRAVHYVGNFPSPSRVHSYCECETLPIAACANRAKLAPVNSKIMKKPTPTDEPDSHEEMEISHLAFDLWQRAGRPPGQYIEYWEKAKGRLISARKAPEEKPATNGPPPKPSGPNHS